MFRSLLLAASLIGAMLATGCAGVPLATHAEDSTAKAYRTDSSTANLYIYRNEIFGAALALPVTLDGKSLGKTASKTYMYRQIAPGTHIINSQEDSDTLSIDVKAGQNYFVWQEVKLGLITGGSKLHLVSEAEGKAGVEECKLVQ